VYNGRNGEVDRVDHSWHELSRVEKYGESRVDRRVGHKFPRIDRFARLDRFRGLPTITRLGSVDYRERRS